MNVHLRNKRTGAIVRAVLELCSGQVAGTHFAIRIWPGGGDSRLIGPLEAAIGFELAASRRDEAAALKLAGFRIGRDERSGLVPLVKQLRSASRGKAKLQAKSPARASWKATSAAQKREFTPFIEPPHATNFGYQNRDMVTACVGSSSDS